MNNQTAPILLWAVDVFANESKLQKETAWAIKALTNKHSFQIFPLYIYIDPLPHQPEEVSKEIFQSVKTRAEEKFEQMIRGVKLKSLLPLKILKVNSRSKKDQIVELLKYAEAIQAQMIAASTRATKGPSRWFLGSFVESLALKSQIPLFIVNPSWKRKPGFKDILFPTDFSEDSLEAFEKVIPFARKMGSRILIFHKFFPEIPPIATYAFALVPPYVDSESFKNELEALRAKGKKWERIAKDLGVSAVSQIETKGVQSASEAILKKAKTGSYLIAMASRSNAIESTLMGSVTRQLIRQSLAPLWIIHPEQADPQVKQDQPYVNPLAQINRPIRTA